LYSLTIEDDIDRLSGIFGTNYQNTLHNIPEE